MGAARETFHVLTYNIHKGFSALNRKFILQKIKESIDQTHADLVCLQEVLGEHKTHGNKFKDYPTVAQFEFLADKTWPHFSYGKNAVYTEGHHGNAILCKYPITFSENQDVSFNTVERRGLLHVAVDLPGRKQPLHAFCVHLGLFQKDRTQQIIKLAKRISKMVPADAPLVIAGDFNDWRQKASDHIKSELGMDEAFLSVVGAHAATYPSNLPMLALDRIYFRNLKCKSVHALRGTSWSKLSDHLPLLAEFTLE